MITEPLYSIGDTVYDIVLGKCVKITDRILKQWVNKYHEQEQILIYVTDETSLIPGTDIPQNHRWEYEIKG